MPLQNGPKIKAELRRSEVLGLKIAGGTNQTIAKQLGVSPVQVQKDVRRRLSEIAEHDTPSADNLRALMMLRYERLLLQYWQRAIQGDDGALRNVLQIMRAEREINGLDPDKPLITMIDNRLQVQVNVGDEDPRERLDAILSAIVARRGEDGGDPALTAPRG